MSAKETGIRKASQGSAKKAINQASTVTSDTEVARPAHVTPKGTVTFARRFDA